MKREQELSFTEIGRRRFMQGVARWSAGIALGVGLQGVAYSQEHSEFTSPGFMRPVIPGACLQPVTDVEKTVAAMVDTVIPGPSVDPDGAPGALEACALNFILDEAYPFKAAAPLIAAALDQLAQNSFGNTFVNISYEQRLQVLLEAQQRIPLLRLAFRAIRSTFYGGAYNGVGLSYVAYPGPNLGYRHIPEASFRRPVCKEMSETGWLP